MIRKIKRISFLGLLVAIIVSVTMSPFAVLAAEVGNELPGNVIPNIQQSIDDETKAYLLTLGFAKCLYQIDISDDAILANPDGIFDLGDDYEATVGNYYAQSLFGNSKQGGGQIECSQGEDGMGDIVALTASALGVDWQVLICGEDVMDGTGVIKPVLDSDGNVKNSNANNIAFDVDGYCGVFVEGNWAQVNMQEGKNGYDSSNKPGHFDIASMKDTKNGYVKHIANLYNTKAEKEGWVTRFPDNFYASSKKEIYGLIQYYAYLVELNNYCGLERQSEVKPDTKGAFVNIQSNGSLGFRKSYVDTRTANNKKLDYTYNDTLNKDSEYNIFYNSSVKKCEDLVKVANELANDYYYPYVKRRFNTACQGSILRRKEEIERSGQKLTDDTINQINDRSDAKKWRDGLGYIEETEETDEDGKKTGAMLVNCVDVGGLLGATQEEFVDDESADEERIEASCYDNSGGIGWLVCPIIDFAGDAIPGMYEAFVENSLVLDAGMFAAGTPGGEGVRSAWSQILGYANILFIGFFLFVIFSQLTGIGLDNYGIKKVLPKIIAAAILINLSYFICQFAIDIANILGHGIKGLLANIGTIESDKAAMLNIQGKGAGSTVWMGFMIPVLVGLICVGAVLAVGKYLLLVVLMAIISIAMAVVSLFVMLSIRKAFAVMLVIVAPLAFLCYMLPNAKPIYRKWFNAFKAVLLAYPICSLIIYGGEAVARLMILSSGGNNIPVWTTISAAIIGVVPIFFIPKILKSSMSAISGAISNVSSRISGAGKRKLGESNFADRMRKNRLAHAAGIRFDSKGNVIKTDNLRTKLGRKLAGKGNRLTAYESRLNAMRGRALNQQIEDSYVGQFVGDGSMSSMNQYLAGGRAKKLSDTIGNTVGAINSGNYEFNDGEKNVHLNPNDIDQLADALREAVGKNGNDSNMKALMSVMSGTDAGRQAMRTVIGEADEKGSWRDPKSRKEAASHIMNQYAGTFKQADRTVYDWAKIASTGTDEKQTDNKMRDSIDAGKLKTDYILGSDDKAMARLYTQAAKQADNGNGDTSLQSQLQQMSKEILNDPQMLQGVDANRRGFIEHMASGSNFNENNIDGEFLKPEVVKQARDNLQGQQANANSQSNVSNGGGSSSGGGSGSGGIHMDNATADAINGAGAKKPEPHAPYTMKK